MFSLAFGRLSRLFTLSLLVAGLALVTNAEAANSTTTQSVQH